MPELARFYGIVVRIHFNDHAPPHVHALYGEDEALIDIQSLSVLRGSLPRRALAMVLEWASQHRGELDERWNAATQGRRVDPIPPLD